MGFVLTGRPHRDEARQNTLKPDVNPVRMPAQALSR
jgi:hypothetical protein